MSPPHTHTHTAPPLQSTLTAVHVHRRMSAAHAHSHKQSFVVSVSINMNKRWEETLPAAFHSLLVYTCAYVCVRALCIYIEVFKLTALGRVLFTLYFIRVLPHHAALERLETEPARAHPARPRAGKTNRRRTFRTFHISSSLREVRRSLLSTSCRRR